MFAVWFTEAELRVSELNIIGSDNGLSPGRRQAIIWTNAGILSIGPLGINFSDIFIEILIFSFKKMRVKVSSAKWRSLCLDLNMLMGTPWQQWPGLPIRWWIQKAIQSSNYFATLDHLPNLLLVILRIILVTPKGSMSGKPGYITCRGTLK